MIGIPSQMILMKAVKALDEGSRKVLAEASIAAFGFRNSEGLPHTALVGGVKGFLRVESAVRISFDLGPDQPNPVKGGGVSMVFLLLGVGETLRVNGSVADRTDTSVTIDVEEAYVHCARCILRSSLWKKVKTDIQRPNCRSLEPFGSGENEAKAPFSDASIAGFLASSTFIAVSSWDTSGSSDTSPKGDPAGFIRILDGHTLAIPDRRGNRRADTFHNILTCDLISLVALVPGCDEVLHISGTAYITDDPALLSTIALGGKPPVAALIVRGERAEIVASKAVCMSKMWSQSAQLDPNETPDLNVLATHQMSNSKTSGLMAWVMRTFAKGLGRISPKFMQKAMNLAYRKALKNEGY
jgi:predicted pyridoxine 5'-phosphate oxidase superfamily flavin-nucleotide-binding protein